MAMLSEGNNLNFRPYMGSPSSLLVKKQIENPTKESSISSCDKNSVDISVICGDSGAVEDTAPVLDIVINNVVCSFNLRCHLNLKQIALQGYNVEYRRENGMVTMKLRNPSTTASIWSSGKITCTGATSNSDAKKAARRFARVIQQLGFRVKFTNFRIVNVLGTCAMPFAIRISHFSMKHRQNASYEPELHPGVTYKIKEIRATLKIFSTGNITITAPSIENVQAAVEHIFPLVHEFRREKIPPSETVRSQPPCRHIPNQIFNVKKEAEDEEELIVDEDVKDSDESWG